MITPLERHQVIATACCSPRQLGFDRHTWTLESLQEVLVRSKRVRR
jgi:hypothetical protein